MKPCLDSLWKLLNDDFRKMQGINIRNLDKETTKELVETIKDFFGSDDRIKKPEHIELFVQLLNNCVKGTLTISPDQELKEIVEKSRFCDCCVVCQGCSLQFYQSVLQNNFPKNIPASLQNYFIAPPHISYYEMQQKNMREHFLLKDKLVCLKGFSSSTPAIDSATFHSKCVGGGIYINYAGYGIVIDPGIGFVQSMHNEGVFINDIDVVIITHDHMDHNADANILS